MTKALCIRYTLVMIGLAVLTAIIAFALEHFFGLEWPSGVNIVIIFVTAMITGDYCFNKLNEMPDKNTMWKLGLYFTIIQFVMAAITMAFLIQVDPVISDLVGEVGLGIWGSIAFFAFLIITLLNRFGFSFGINQAKKKADAKKAKE